MAAYRRMKVDQHVATKDDVERALRRRECCYGRRIGEIQPVKCHGLSELFFPRFRHLRIVQIQIGEGGQLLQALEPLVCHFRAIQIQPGEGG